MSPQRPCVSEPFDLPWARRRLLRHLMQEPRRYLAAALAEITDEILAVQVGAPERAVFHLRLREWPRADRWDQDVQAMARAIHADPALLDELLRRLPRWHA